MNNAKWQGLLAVAVLLLGTSCVGAQDWPQWRGPNRDNKVVGFIAPQTWPKALTNKWTTKVGVGDSSPVLAGDKLYVFTRQGADEVALCLDAASGKILWQEKYATPAPKPPAAGIHSGPRSTPAVAEGKVCTLGVQGVLTCFDAATGKIVWQKKDTGPAPRFAVASSPLILDGKCIAFVGALTAFDLLTGEVKWTSKGESPAYGSPVLMTVDNTKEIVTPTARSLEGIDPADGKTLWKVPFSGKYNSGTPIVDGQTVFYSNPGGGTAAYKIEKMGDSFAAKPLWKKTFAADKYNTPTLKDGLLFGLSGGSTFFCMDAKTGETLWNDSARHGQCGEILDAGSVLLALTSDSQLIAFQPNGKEYKELAHYRVADTATWPSPIIAGNRVFVKGSDTVTLWTIQ